MKILDWVRGWFIKPQPFTLRDCDFYEVDTEIAFMKYALQICMNRIITAIIQCHFKTFENKKFSKKSLWYKFNVAPNLNQSASDFWSEIVFKMLTDKNGALVVTDDRNRLLIADSYDLTEYAVYENGYKNVVVKGHEFKRTYNESDVLRFQFLNGTNETVIENVYNSFGKLITNSIRNFNRKNAKKVFVKIDAMFDQFRNQVDEETGKTEVDLLLDEIFEKRLVGYFSDKDSATPIEEGLEIEDVNLDARKAAQADTEDIRNIFDAIINICADSFGIPRGLLKGDVADVEAMTDNFITYCIDPIAKVIEDELNRKTYTMEEYLKGDKVVVKTDGIKGKDITKIASSAEALYRIRSLNTNEVREKIGEELIDEPWADEYMETKNYQTVNQHLKGGEG